jgi:hypothetical protein
MSNPGQISTDDSRFAAIAVDGANNEFHVVNTAGHDYRYAVKRMPDGKIVFRIPGDKHSGAGVAVTHDGLLIVSAAIHDPATGNYPICHFAVPGVAQPFPGGGGDGGSTSTIDQVARDAAAHAQTTATAAQQQAGQAQATATQAVAHAQQALAQAKIAQQAAAAVATEVANLHVDDVAWQKALDAVYWICTTPEGQASGAGQALKHYMLDVVAGVD